MKILLICSTSNSVLTFRKTLIEEIQKKGHDVAAICFDSQNKAEIEERGVEFHCVEDDNRSTNPFKVLSLKKRLYRIIKNVLPDVVFTFMMKPNIFGTAAAKKAKIEKIYSMVEGAGDVFIRNGFKWKAIRTLVCSMYRKSFAYSQKVFFLNKDDRKEFLDRGLVKEKQCEIIPGIGVDLQHFEYRPLENNNTFLMIARMLTTKGIFEYCKAARKVKQSHPQAVFNYLGGEGTVKVADIQEFIDDGSINYLGTTKDVRPYLSECSVFVLPSYREGMPVSVMEAEAIGRAVIVADNPGIRESAKDGHNGFLIKNDNLVDGLSEKIIWFLENPEQIAVMGENSRSFAEERFDYKKINEKIIKTIGI